MRDVGSNCEDKRPDSMDFWEVVKRDVQDGQDEEKKKSQVLGREKG